MGRFTAIPQDTFKALQLDAGILLKRFDPDNPVFDDEDLICATTGGINASCVPSYSDLGEDVDNCPNNMKELKHLDSWECKITTTSLGTSAELIKMSLGCADIDPAKPSRIVPRRDLKQTDFSDIWWVGDRADGGMVAIKLINALSTGGFTIQTTKNGKGQISIELTGHVSINDQDTMPMEFYSADAPAFGFVKVSPEASTTTVFGTLVGDLQVGVSIDNDEIFGTLRYYDDESSLVTTYGAGNFIALKFSNLDPNATSVKVGLEPSEGTGLVEIINDPDKNGVFKITNKDTQKFKVVQTDGTKTTTQTYDLSNLVCEDSGA